MKKLADQHHASRCARLKVNRTRSALTMLGIIIGVAAVIAMVGVGAGATERIQEQIQSIGSNLIIVLPGSISSNGVRLGSGGVATLTEDDAKAIAAECPSVALDGADRARRRAGGLRQQQLGHHRSGRDAGLHDAPRLHHAVRSVLHDAGRGCRRQDRRAGRDRRAESVRRQRSHRPGRHHQERPVHRRRRADAERPVADGPGSGRRHPAADLDGHAEGPRRQQGQREGCRRR